MRTRAQILKPAIEMFEDRGVSSVDFTASSMTAVLEVLLDIRDLLSRAKSPEERQNETLED